MGTAAEQIKSLIDSGAYQAALEAADKILESTSDGRRDMLFFKAIALRSMGRLNDAIQTLNQLEQSNPELGRLFEQRGHCFQQLGNTAAAIKDYRHAVELNDALPDSWQALERLCAATGQWADAQYAKRCLSRLQALPPALAIASGSLSEGDLETAEKLVRKYLQQHGNHIEGMRLLAQIAIKRDVLDDAELLLENIVAFSPDYHDARYEYAIVLNKRRRYQLQLVQAQKLLMLEPANRNYLMIYAQARDGLGDYDEALRVYQQLLEETPDNSELHVLVGNALRAFGRHDDAIESYRAAARSTPTFGNAYLGLANMKTYRFTEDELETMQKLESQPAISVVDRYHLCFALGKALEDRKQFAESFSYYERGNSLRRSVAAYQPEIMERSMRLQAEICTREFFEARKGWGCSRPDPIFVLGLPRSGSTLIEQILASHSQVEGTMELPDIPRIAHLFRNRDGNELNPRYPAILADVTPDEFKELGEMYLADTQVYRHGAKYFIDKMPSNFREIGLIHLILPNAKIIDARREPMACCFGNFKQLFSRGQEFTYSLSDLGRYYRNYIDLMDHWDRALPGKVLHVRHEDVVADLEGTIRRILAFCGLEFEPACLEFYRTERSVRTVSSEQVRRPIYKESVDQWRHYEQWLGPLKAALGPLAPSDNPGD